MMEQSDQAANGLGQSADALEAAMRAAVEAEISETIKRWKEQGSPSTKVARQMDGDPESETLLSGWTRLPWKLIQYHVSWEYAMAERLYRIAVEMAHAADERNPGLNLHKGIDYFEIGLMQFHQGRYQEAAHNILVAVEEDAGAGWKREDAFAAKELRKYTVGPTVQMMRPATQLCHAAGLAHITDTAVTDVAEAMFYRDLDPAGGDYDPSWILWLFRALKGLEDLPGPIATAVTPVRRLEALQDLTFFYEAALKSRAHLGKCTLKAVVREVQCGKPAHIPANVAQEWDNHTSFDPGDQQKDADACLDAIQNGQFGLVPGSKEAFCYRALLTLGLVRNVTHHSMDLGCRLVGSDYEWVQRHVLAALLLSW